MRTSAPNSAATTFIVRPSLHVASATAAAFPRKDVIRGGYSKVLNVPKISLKCPTVTKSSFYTSSGGPYLQLHARASKEKPGSQLLAATTSFFGNPDAGLCRTSWVGRARKALSLPRAYKENFFSFSRPVLTEKPKWWWRTLACVPYFIALQLSDVGSLLYPFLERHEFCRDLIFFVPGAISRLPSWFSMVYFYLAYSMIVQNKEWPHFFRYHLMMGMLLETSLQIIWCVSNFMPLIHYNGRFGIYYWPAVGMAYILILLQCVICALAGGYAHLPFISEAAYIHTLFNIGGYQQPLR